MQKAVEFILSRFPAVRNRLDEHMVEVINGAVVALVVFNILYSNYLYY